MLESVKLEESTEASRRRRKKKRGISPLLVILPALVIVGVGYFLFRMTQATVDFRIPKAAEQVYAGQTFPVQKGSVISIDRDGVAKLNRQDTASDLNSLPIYYQGENSMITAAKYSYIDPRNNKELSVSQLTELKMTDAGSAVFTHDNKTEQTANGFLYDGDKLYIFLEPVTLSFNGYNFELAAMSYVEADYRNSIILYNRETGETFMEPATTAVTATGQNGDYAVSLLGASYEIPEGGKRLLVNNPDFLEPLI